MGWGRPGAWEGQQLKAQAPSGNKSKVYAPCLPHRSPALGAPCLLAVSHHAGKGSAVLGEPVAQHFAGDGPARLAVGQHIHERLCSRRAELPV